jgi:hypothetical protein
MTSPNSDRPRVHLVLALAFALVAAALFAAWSASQPVSTPFRAYDSVNRLEPGEAGFFLGFAVLGTLCAFALAVALRALEQPLARAAELACAHARALTIGLALAAAVGCALLSALAFRHQNFTDDEYAYLFTAKLLSHGHLWIPPRAPEVAFRYQFLTTYQGRQFAIYGLLHPALLLPGLLLGVPQLGMHVLVAAIVLATAALAKECYGARAGLLAAALCATSPFLLATGATCHNATTATALLCGFAWLCARFERRLSLACAGLAGVLLGLALNVRALEAAGFGAALVPLALYRLATAPQRTRRFAGYLAMAAGLAVGLALYAWTNHALTGSATTSAYEIFNQRYPGTKMFGFGKVPIKHEYTVEEAFSKTIAASVRAWFWMFGFPIGLALALCARGRRALALALPALLVLAGYFFYYSNSVYDTGPVYCLCMLPLIAVLSARGIAGLAPRVGRNSALAGCVALVVCAATLFAPRELAAARAVARSVARPKLAAAEMNLHHAIILAKRMQPSGPAKSWVFFRPIPGEPLADEDVVWLNDAGPAWQTMLADKYPGWALYRLRWVGEQPILEPVDREP